MSDFSFQFVVFSNPLIFWSGFLLFLFLMLPLNAFFEAGDECPYPFPAPLKVLQWFLKWVLLFVLWCLVFELLFLRTPSEQDLSVIDRQWEQILKEQSYTNFVEAVWEEKAEKLPDCTDFLWTWHGNITTFSFSDYQKCVKREFIIMRTGKPPREESIGRLLKEVVQYNASYMAWDGYFEKINSFVEQSSFLKNISQLAFIQKIKEDIDIDTDYIAMESKTQKERQKRQLEYRIEELKNDPEVFFKKRIAFPDEYFSPQTSIPEENFTVQPLFPVVPIIPDESAMLHAKPLLTNDYTLSPASRQ